MWQCRLELQSFGFEAWRKVFPQTQQELFQGQKNVKTHELWKFVFFFFFICQRAPVEEFKKETA